MAELHPGRDRLVVPDQDGRRLDLTIRAVAVMAFAFGLIDAPLGLVLGRSGVIGTGVVAILGGTWLLSESLRRGAEGRITLISRMTWVVVSISLFGSVAQPEIAAAAALATLIPPMLASPFVDGRRLMSVMALAGVAGTACAIAGRVGLTASDSLLGLTLSLPGFVAGYLAVLLLLWSLSTQLKGSADDLRSVVVMSSDLSRTLDPDRIGDQIALHVARAVGLSSAASTISIGTGSTCRFTATTHPSGESTWPRRRARSSPSATGCCAKPAGRFATGRSDSMYPSSRRASICPPASSSRLTSSQPFGRHWRRAVCPHTA
jgi:hypothetical protein